MIGKSSISKEGTRMNHRFSGHYKLSTELSMMSDQQLRRLLKGTQMGSGWGKNYVAKVGGRKVFIKSIPLTDRELKNPFSTKNHFRLPLYYNYGVGSAGFGAYRELALHRKTTNWVLAGDCKHFPLMHHYRILPKSEKTKKSSVRGAQYFKYWNNSKSIESYIKARAAAQYEIVIFLEFVPHRLNNWIKGNTGQFNRMSKQLLKTFSFLKENNVVHFDAHFGNILTDGQRVILTDFGLGLDLDFELSPKERAFCKLHKNYDYMEYIGCCSIFLWEAFKDLKKKQQQTFLTGLSLENDEDLGAFLKAAMSNLRLCQKSLSIDPAIIRFLKKHRELIELSNGFFFELRHNPKKNTKYPHSKVKKLLSVNGLI
jgi:serine/threonine protein kinase